MCTYNTHICVYTHAMPHGTLDVGVPRGDNSTPATTYTGDRLEWTKKIPCASTIMAKCA